LKSTSFLLDAAKPETRNGRKLTAAQMAFDFPHSIYQWWADVGWRKQRLNKTVQQLHRATNQNTIHGGCKFSGREPFYHLCLDVSTHNFSIHVSLDYAWSELASPSVDIGGGIGSLEMELVKEKENSNLSFTIFDIPKTIENSKKVEDEVLLAELFESLTRHHFTTQIWEAQPLPRVFCSWQFFSVDTFRNTYPLRATDLSYSSRFA
jgi:hypothetical protein